MKTYSPIQGMHCCANDTGDYVEKTDYDAVKAELAVERARSAHKDLVLKKASEYIHANFDPGPIPADQPTDADWSFVDITDTIDAAMKDGDIK